MVFDNAQFEKNANTSIHTLEHLKKVLNFEGATKGLNEIEAKTKSIKMDALIEGVQTVADKFDALGVVGFTVLQNLTNRAVDAGMAIASALTIEPIKMGLSEYETQINAVQTILANTQDKLKEEGYDDQGRLDLVNEKLDELNTYADKTIYNFTEMTRNIGTFTAAGVELNTATNAIQGIANLAAVSGSNSQQASTAMYQLSQALASGTVKLQDWNSVVNAGMGGQLFQDRLKETARAHGIAVDEMIATNGSFRESLQEGWITAEILTETLEKFTAGSEGVTQAQLEQQKELWRSRGYSEKQIESLTSSMHVLTEAEEEHIRALWRDRGYTEEQIDGIFELGQMSTDAATKVKTFSQLIDTTKEALQSGWTQSFEYIIGDFEQAKELWTEISDILNLYIGASAEARNATLKEWSEGGGRAAIIEGLRNSFQALLSVVNPLKEAFDEIFPKVTAQQLIELSEKFRDFTATLKLTDEQGMVLKENAKNILTIFSDGFGQITGLAKDILDFVKPIETLSAIFSSMKDAGKNIMNAVKPLEVLSTLFSSIKDVGKILVNVFLPIKDAFTFFFTSVVDSAGAFDSFTKSLKGLLEFAKSIKNFTSNLVELTDVTNPTKVNRIGATIQMVALQILLVGKNLFDILKVGVSIVIRIGKAIWDIIRFIKLLLPSGQSMAKMIGDIGRVAVSITDKIRAFVEAIDFEKPIFAATVAIEKFIIAFVRFIDSIRNSEFINALHEMFKNLILIISDTTDKVTNFIKSVKEDTSDTKAPFLEGLQSVFEKIKNIVDKIAPAIKDRIDQIRQALASMVSGAAKDVTKFNGLDIIGAIGVGASGFGIYKLISFFNTITDHFKDIGDGLLEQLGAIKDSLIDTFGAIQQNLKADALKSIAIAIGILAASLFVISLIDTKRLLGSLAALSILIYELNLLLTKIQSTDLKTAKNVTTISAALISFATAILLLAIAMRIIGTMNTKEITNGLVTITILLVELSLVLKSLSTMEKDLVKGSGILIGMAFAIGLLVIPIKILGGMDIQSLTKGLLSVTMLILTLSASLAMISANEGNLEKASRTIISMAIALLLLIIPVKVLGGMDLESLGKGLIAVISLILSLGIALKLIPEDANEKALAILALAAAVSALGYVVKMLGEMNLKDLAKGLGSIAVLLVMLGVAAKTINKDFTGATGLIALAGALLIMSVALKIISTIPIPSIIAGLAAFAATLFIFAVAAQILSPVTPVLLAMGAALLAFGAAIALAGAGVMMLAVAFTTYGVAIIGFITALLNMLPLVGEMIAKMVVSFVTTIAESLPAILEAVASIITGILGVLAEQVPLIVELLLSLLNELLTKLLEYVPQMANTALQILLGFLNAIAENIQQIVEAGMAIMIGFMNGISEKLPELIDAAFKVIISFIDGLANAIRENHNALFDAIGNLISAIIEAILDGITGVAQAGSDLIFGEGGLLEAIGGFFNDMFEAGANLVQGFIDGLLSMPGRLWDSACSLANDAWNAITNTLDEHSPSRLTFGGGANFTQGFINGILSLKSEAVSESAGLAEATMDAFANAIDADYEPTITPVMDLSNIQNGIGSMNSMFSSIPSTYGINGSIDAQKLLNNRAMLSLGNGSDYGSIIEAMHNIQSDLAKYTEIMSRLNIVMDTGTLVGQLTPGIDRQLGRNAMMAGRGVM